MRKMTSVQAGSRLLCMDLPSVTQYQAQYLKNNSTVSGEQEDAIKMFPFVVFPVRTL